MLDITLADPIKEQYDNELEWKEVIRDWNAAHSETTIIFGHSKPRTLETKVLHSIIRHEKKLINYLFK